MANSVPLLPQMIQVLPLCPVDKKAQKALEHVAFVVLAALLFPALTQVPFQLVGQAGAHGAEVTMTVVLDGVVGTAQENSRHVGPGGLRLPLHDVKDPAFFAAPGRISKQRVQLVDPPLSTLLSRSTGDVLRDDRPLARPVVRD